MCVYVCVRHTLFCVLYIPYYSPQVVYFTISCSALHHPVKLNTHRSTVDENLFTCVFSRFFFFHRATGGPEVAMGTGPWPQPPTEAEQLQALMAAANGGSYTSSPLSSLLWVPPSLFQAYLLLVFWSGCVGSGGLFSFLFGWRATSQTQSLIKLCLSTLAFPFSGREPSITSHSFLDVVKLICWI